MVNHKAEPLRPYLCVACFKCREFCPTQAITPVDHEGVINSGIGCGESYQESTLPRERKSDPQRSFTLPSLACSSSSPF